jgi:transposase
MVRPLSNRLRKRVVAAVVKDESCCSVALRFGIAVSSVKWSQRYRAAGSVARGHLNRYSMAPSLIRDSGWASVIAAELKVFIGRTRAFNRAVACAESDLSDEESYTVMSVQPTG